MKQPTFLGGVAVALGASLFGSVLYSALTTAFPSAAVLHLVIGAIGLAYVLYLLSRSRERVGRITILVAWAVAAAAAWLTALPLSLYLMVHVGLIWLIRSLYFYSSVLSAAVDLALSAVSLAAAIWAATHSGSLFLSIWCFFLVQALFVAIPAGLRQKTGDRGPVRDSEDPFQRAHRAAEVALRKLSSVR